MRFILFCFLLVFSTVLTLNAEPGKQIYAHYMGCFPVANGPSAFHRRTDPGKVKHTSRNYLNALGSRILNWYLVPPGITLSREKSAELDIMRAIRGGIDGFAVDAWAGGEGARNVFDNLFKVAEQHDLPFKVTICLDASCLPRNKQEPGNNIKAFAGAIKYVLDKHGNSPKLARRNGKPLIFGYHSRGILRTKEMKKLPEGPAKWDKLAKAFKEVETLVGQPIFFHFGIGAFYHNVPQKNRDYVAAAKWAGNNFPAVGAFLDGEFYKYEKQMAQAIKAGGAEWAQPLFYQYNNRQGSLYVDRGFNIFRNRWQMARELDSSLIQFVTWNDYGEDTVLAPGYNTGYTVLELNKFYVDWWKNGKPPKPEKDKMFLTFRRYGDGCNIFPFKTRRHRSGVLEVITLLTEPAEVKLPGRNISYKAPAGMYFKQFPLEKGSVKAELIRDGKAVISLIAPEKVTDKPFRQDNSMVCFSSEYESNWELDFPDAKPFYYSEYDDDDNDGLPNWFEMYWFGKFLDFTTTTVAKAEDDPDKDGLTNLQEYLAQSDPTKPKAVYNVGDVWDMATVYKGQGSFNPDMDFNGTPVWYYMYKHGEYGRIARDGNYPLCPYSQKKAPYTGPLVHISPYRDSMYKHVHGWICRIKKPDGYKLLFRPRNNALIIVGWKSPVNGVVNISGTVDPVKGQDGITLEINKGIESVFKKAYNVGDGGEFIVDDVNVKKGEYLYFISDSAPGSGHAALVIDSLKIKLSSGVSTGQSPSRGIECPSSDPEILN